MEISANEMRNVPLPTSGDVLTDLIRQGAKQLLSQAIEAEVAEWIESHKGHQDDQGRRGGRGREIGWRGSKNPGRPLGRAGILSLALMTAHADEWWVIVIFG